MSIPNKISPIKFDFGRLFIIFIVIFLSCLVSITYIDKGLTIWVSENQPNQIFRFFKSVTRLGKSDIWFLLVIGGLSCGLLLRKINFNGKSKFYGEWVAKSKHLLLSGLALAIIVFALKIFFGRYRPYKFLDDNLYGFQFFQIDSAMLSFPSGHSATIFFIATLFSHFLNNKKLTFFLLMLACIVAISRVAIFQHYFSDIVIGSYLGYAGGLITCFYLKDTSQ